ncbi:hypothetical protein FH729_25100, partial [Bacteroides thetaiotaomicron]|nr:hypothetical protein [Bacteroides thetaiotaomicron]
KARCRSSTTARSSTRRTSRRTRSAVRATDRPARHARAPTRRSPCSGARRRPRRRPFPFEGPFMSSRLHTTLGDELYAAWHARAPV